MKSFAPLALIALTATAVSAHFTLDYPQTRGFDEDIEPNFCGGFNVSATRSPFPLNSGPILIDSHHTSADVAVLISFAANPTSFAQFNMTAAGASYGLLKNFSTISGEGEFCFNVDVASLGVAGVANGTIATIQVEYNGGDGVLLQCSDVVLLTDFTVPANVTSACTSSKNGGAVSGSTSTALIMGTTATGSAPSAAATSSKPSSAGIVSVGKGLGAAGVLLGAMAVLL